MDRRLGGDWEEREAARVEATRARHDQIKARVLNPNSRLRGRDESGLAMQIAEKLRAADEEKADADRYAEQMRQTTQAVAMMELRERERKLAKAKEAAAQWQLEAMRKQEEKRAEREEYHRMATHVGVSSAQQFDGEDSASLKRRVVQQHQMKKWVEEQTAERKRRQDEEKREEQEFFAQLSDHLTKVEKMEKELAEERRQTLKGIDSFNADQAKRIKDDLEFQRKLESLENQHEKMHSFESLLDKPQYFINNPNRKRPDHYRGADKEYLAQLRDEQQRQVMEKRERDARQRAEEEADAERERQSLQMANFYSYEDQRARRDNERSIQLENQRQAEFKKYKEMCERQDRNGFSDDFFGNFGRSHR